MLNNAVQRKLLRNFNLSPICSGGVLIFLLLKLPHSLLVFRSVISITPRALCFWFRFGAKKSRFFANGKTFKKAKRKRQAFGFLADILLPKFILSVEKASQLQCCG